MNPTKLKRRDVLLMASGAAALGLGRLADGVIPSAAVGTLEDLQRAAARMDYFPAAFGRWTSEPGTISEQEQRVASIHRYIRRDYRNTDSGYRVGVTLLCGPAGPMAVHPPTACFEGVGYSLQSGPILASVSGSDSNIMHEFNKSTFQQNTSTYPQTVRAFWGWGTGTNWTAPSRPRMEFRGEPWLYKLYVTDRGVVRTGTTAIPQAESFLRDGLPVLRKALSAGTSGIPNTTAAENA